MSKLLSFDNDNDDGRDEIVIVWVAFNPLSSFERHYDISPRITTLNVGVALLQALLAVLTQFFAVVDGGSRVCSELQVQRK